MKAVYPVILSQTAEWVLAVVPDFDRSTQGKSMAEAIAMARDLIELTGVSMQDIGQEIPDPSSFESIHAQTGEIVTLVDVDFAAYRAFLDNRSVRKNCTLPSWLNARAEKAQMNFSQVLQEALMDRLGLADHKGA